MKDGSTPKLVQVGRVLVDRVVRPTANLGTLTGDAMLRMANGMRAKFDENDYPWGVRKRGRGPGIRSCLSKRAEIRKRFLKILAL